MRVAFIPGLDLAKGDRGMRRAAKTGRGKKSKEERRRTRLQRAGKHHIVVSSVQTDLIAQCAECALCVCLLCYSLCQFFAAAQYRGFYMEHGQESAACILLTGTTTATTSNKQETGEQGPTAKSV